MMEGKHTLGRMKALMEEACYGYTMFASDFQTLRRGVEDLEAVNADLLNKGEQLIDTLEIETCRCCNGTGKENKHDACRDCGGAGEQVYAPVWPDFLRQFCAAIKKAKGEG